MCAGRSCTTCATASARRPRSRKSAIADPRSGAAPGRGRSPDLSRQARGAWGERKAARWYREAGYEILDQNWRAPSGELDLVLFRDGEIVFCEVKSRRSERYGAAAEAVDRRKQLKIRSLAVQWLQANDRRGRVRFDVATVTGVEVKVIEGAF
ncbi:MAG: YraN family protein [Acidimicrobiaceae bacterium]|nr:YraN family protein [Acidimicrobiaceae bacterium]MYK77631.1 YraN family protein [Acidimicrobiaceae bacterium]